MEALRQIAAIAAVIGLLVLALAWLRGRGMAAWRGGARLSRRRYLETAERLPLTAQHSLYLVRMADRGLLVAVSASGCTLIRETDWSALERQGAGREVA